MLTSALLCVAVRVAVRVAVCVAVNLFPITVSSTPV